MNFYIKNKGGNRSEAWIEAWDPSVDDWRVVCEAGLITTSNECFIDTLYTKKAHRKRGFASELINCLKTRFSRVTPIAIEPKALLFWAKMGMRDGLGEANTEDVR